MAKRMTNPFKPTAGAEPPVLAGRDRVIEDFADGLDEGPGAPGRLMRITGPRGSGKTVLLTELGEIAKNRKWTVVDETASKGLLERLIVALVPADGADASFSADTDLGLVKAHTGFGSASAGAPDFRTALTAASKRKSGVMITIDEIQEADEGDLVEIATAVQHLIREKRDVVFVFAGLTTGVLDFINNPVITFLRRATSEELAVIPEEAVREAFRETFFTTGLEIDGEALAASSAATSGYAYLIQLVGYHVWRVANRHAQETRAVSLADVDAGIQEAFRKYDEAVVEPALSGLSERAMKFLVAMAKYDGVCRIRQVAEDLNVSVTSLSSARKTLLSRQVIEAPARGCLAFSIPRLREYLRENSEALIARFG